MLHRILEPELMDTPEEAVDYDSMDHGAVNQAFVDDFLAIWDGTGPVLDVGTGTAQIPIALCQAHERAMVIALDFAKHMLDLAEKNVKKTGLADRVTLRYGDSKSMPFPDNSFPAVISNSIIHHIPEPRDALAEMVRVITPGGSIFVRDLMRPGTSKELEQLVEKYACGANDHQQSMFRDSLHAALSVEEMQNLVGEFGFVPETVCQTTDRHWTFGVPFVRSNPH